MLRKLILRSLPLVALLVAGLGYGYHSLAGTGGEANDKAAAAFVCPITGEELPCPNCCPLN